MRRKDKEITDRKIIEDILDEALVLHLALLDGEQPYIIPVNFGYEGNTIYIHCAPKGKKLDLIKVNNRASFQVETGVELIYKSIPEKCSMIYKSVAGNGRAYLVESREEKEHALQLLMEHYNRNTQALWVFGECLDEVCIIKIEVDSLTGKEALPLHVD